MQSVACGANEADARAFVIRIQTQWLSGWFVEERRKEQGYQHRNKHHDNSLRSSRRVSTDMTEHWAALRLGANTKPNPGATTPYNLTVRNYESASEYKLHVTNHKSQSYLVDRLVSVFTITSKVSL